MKSSKLLVFVMACTLSVAVDIALAINEIKVIIWEGGSPTTLFYDENEDFSIPFTTNMDFVFIYSPTTTHSIGRVTFTGPLSHTVRVKLGSGLFQGDDTDHTPAAQNWKGMTIQSSSAAAWVQFEGSIRGNLTNTVTAGLIHRFDVDGEVQAGIVALNSTQYLFIVEAGAIVHPGNVFTLGGPIQRVHTLGDCDAAIEAGGNINDILVDGNMHYSPFSTDILAGGGISQILVSGTIGSALNPVDITAADGAIGKIKAQAIYADIDVQAGESVGYLEWLEATGGPFVGSINAYALRNDNDPAAQFSCVGDMDADITTTGGNIANLLMITGGDYPAGKTISVNSLAPNRPLSNAS